MARYIIRRILWGIVLIILVSALTFILFNVLPGANPAQLRAGRNASPAIIAHITHELGLDKPVYTQFYDYMKGIILHFNFGYSYYTGASVLSLIKDRLPATLSLTIGAAILWLLAGIPIGIISAIKRGSLLDRSVDGDRAGVRVDAGVLVRPGDAVPVRQRHRPLARVSRVRQLHRADHQPR